MTYYFKKEAFKRIIALNFLTEIALCFGQKTLDLVSMVFAILTSMIDSSFEGQF